MSYFKMLPCLIWLITSVFLAGDLTEVFGADTQHGKPRAFILLIKRSQSILAFRAEERFGLHILCQELQTAHL